MKKLVLICLVVLLILSIGGCQKQPIEPSLQDEQFEQLMDSWFIEEMESDYLTLHYSVKNPSSLGLKTPEVTLGEVEISDEEIENMNRRYQQLLTYDTSKLSQQQMLTYQTVMSYLQITSALYMVEDDYGFVFTPNSGVNNNLITNFQEFEIRDEQDAKDLIALVLDSERYLQDCIDYTLDQADEGIVQSEATMRAIIDQVKRFTSKKEDNEVIKAFQTQVEQLGLSSEYTQQMQKAVCEHLIVAYEGIAQMYQGLLTKSSQAKPICQYPNGKKYYEALLAYKASTTLDVNEVEEQLETAIDDTLNNIIKLLSTLTSETDSDYGYTNPRETLEMLKALMVNDFPKIPEVEFSVNFLDPSVTSENTVAYYLLSPLDDYSHNVIKVNPAYGEQDPNGLVTTLAHEGYPGHLYQHTYFYSLNPSKIRTCLSFTAYAEGWAMYVENWAYSKLESDAKLAKMNALYNQLMYYIYAYTDILVNYEGYEVDDLTNFMSGIFNEDYAALMAESLMDTVSGDPGLFVPYGYGAYKMNELKNQAVALAGRKFDLKEFHELILTTGDTSFDVLETVVNDFYTKK